MAEIVSHRNHLRIGMRRCLTGARSFFMRLERFLMQGSSWFAVIVIIMIGLSAAPAPAATTLTVTPSTKFAFGNVPIGNSKTQQFTIKNSGPGSVTNLVVTGTGQFYSFTINCPTTLTAGAQCSAQVTYTPLTL